MPDRQKICNDIDDGMSFWPHGVTSDGRLYEIIQMAQLKSHLKAQPDKESKLQELVRTSCEADNPIIRLVTPKKK